MRDGKVPGVLKSSSLAFSGDVRSQGRDLPMDPGSRLSAQPCSHQDTLPSSVSYPKGQ